MKINLNSLYIVSTPIGNLDDITIRAIEVLKKSDIILCEDTRRSLKLLNHLNIKKKLISYHKFNEKKQINNVLEHIKKGKILSLISDAGTPLLSDPGKLLINECNENQIKIIPVPGVSSITAAMSVSGFNDQFLFYGFLPKKEKEVDKVLSSLSIYEYSQVFFIPSIKVNFYLKKLKEYFPRRKLMIAKEMTKLHEEFIRFDADNYKSFKNPLKGELTIVVSNIKNKAKKINKEIIINKIKKYLKKYSLKDTVNLIMETENVNKKDIYKLCLKIKDEKNN
tara:strand:- start:420 stop:1259 length:840 start_codon:yes stop_codon:yes gene_type:complete